ncbi:MAG TPA: NapC/NirT family cytochrome c [Coriobacteriia bacterium]|nr:NapC/NirT family cytochrome c [Coriobacteriia bacterium]
MEPEAGRRSRRERLGLALVIVAGVVVLFTFAGFASSSPALCGSCHEMAPSHESWSRSAHTSVNCVGCHETPRAWYGLPLRAAERARLYARDTWRHLSGRLGEPADPSAIGRTSPMPDEVCLQCHTADRRATSGFRILIDHVEHAERTGSCVACHVYTAHPDAELGRPLSLMMRCYDCHGTAEHPQASAECGVCHPPDFDLRPPTHLAEPWARDHGFAALRNRDVCALCHVQESCDGCHGVEMPHPEEWERGPRGHGEAVAAGRGVCYRCHTEEPDSCAACHHEGYDPALGTWLEQHYGEARRTGAAACLDCHEPLFCARCHDTPPGEDG